VAALVAAVAAALLPLLLWLLPAAFLAPQAAPAAPLAQHVLVRLPFSNPSSPSIIICIKCLSEKMAA
jgi:hypothetical protein